MRLFRAFSTTGELKPLEFILAAVRNARFLDLYSPTASIVDNTESDHNMKKTIEGIFAFIVVVLRRIHLSSAGRTVATVRYNISICSRSMSSLSILFLVPFSPCLSCAMRGRGEEGHLTEFELCRFATGSRSVTRVGLQRSQRSQFMLFSEKLPCKLIEI